MERALADVVGDNGDNDDGGGGGGDGGENRGWWAFGGVEASRALGGVDGWLGTSNYFLAAV